MTSAFSIAAATRSVGSSPCIFLGFIRTRVRLGNRSAASQSAIPMSMLSSSVTIRIFSSSLQWEHTVSRRSHAS